MTIGGAIVRGGEDGVTPITRAVIWESDVSHVRILAATMAGRIGFNRPESYRLATAVSEPANDLAFHATGGGQMSLTPISAGERLGIEIVAEDDGPGITDIALAMTDGFTTDGGLGGGLPGSRRLMDEFAIVSTFGQGTKIMASLWR
jgi:serine/threonine-protein kinase RsbT